MRLEFELSPEDWHAAVWVHNRRSGNRPDPFRSLRFAGGSAAGLGIFLAVMRVDGGGRITPFALIAFGLFVPMRLIAMRHAAMADAWAENERLIQPTVWEIDANGVRTTSVFSDHTYRWGAFERWAEGSTEFLIYQSADQFYTIPKRAFASEAEMVELRKLLGENVAGRARGFPVTQRV